jgi:endonuclease YncB( thermonuclease family)
MQFLIVLLAAMVAIPQPLSQSSARFGSLRTDPVLVRTVFNGDTIDVAAVGRVRLLGIDVPEVGHGLATSAPFAVEAKARLTALVLHHWVRLEQDGERLDVYNRHLAYVTTGDGLFVNAIMVREGFARVSARTALKRLGELKSAEREAQEARRGIWGSAPSIPATSYTPPAKAPAPRAPAAPKPSGKPPSRK